MSPKHLARYAAEFAGRQNNRLLMLMFCAMSGKRLRYQDLIAGGVMVKEVQIIVGLQDITKFGLQCTKCEATVMLRPDAPFSFPESCPVCHNGWRHDEAADLHRKFTELIRMLRAMEQTPIQVRMMFNGEEA